MIASLLRLVFGTSRVRLDSALSVERIGDDYDYLVTLADGRRFRGGGTVWRSYPSGKRCGVFTESSLADVLARERWTAEPNDIEQGGVTEHSPQHTRTLDGSRTQEDLMTLQAWHVYQDHSGKATLHHPVSTPAEALQWIGNQAQVQLHDKRVEWNAFGLEVFSDGEWSEWYDANGYDINEISPHPISPTPGT